MRKKVILVGGGFAGLYAAQALRRAPVDVTLIDRRNFHLFQPLLYQVATGGLSPADIASPLRGVLARQENAKVVQGAVTGLDAIHRQVLVGEAALEYDFLIVATGSKHHYFGNDRWQSVAPGLKTVEDALAMRRRILSAFERAEVERDPRRREALLTFVVVGGGPTGVELAGAIGELANHTLRNNFRSIDPADAKILLIEATGRILPVYPASLSDKAQRSLERLGVTVTTNRLVKDISPDHVLLEGPTGEQQLPTQTVLWAAGVTASSFGEKVAAATSSTTDRQGRILVNPDLSIPGFPEIFVCGDLAHFKQNEQPLPGLAPVAMQQGAYVARRIGRQLRGKETPPFRYRDWGTMAVIGRASAVAQLGRLRLHGYLAWLVWLFIHLINLVEFENRILVLIQWGWNYFTRNRSARLITNDQSTERNPRKRESPSATASAAT